MRDNGKSAFLCLVMALHLQKLCVGCDSAEELAAWIGESLARKRSAGQPVEQIHTTRMMPSRRDEILDGGSLFWVMAGTMRVRQRLLDLRAVTGDDGISRCQFVLEPVLVPVEPIARRPFQGWRYLADTDAPRDLAAVPETDLPVALVQELRALGLW